VRRMAADADVGKRAGLALQQQNYDQSQTSQEHLLRPRSVAAATTVECNAQLFPQSFPFRSRRRW
jgi:hypothetical protein